MASHEPLPHAGFLAPALGTVPSSAGSLRALLWQARFLRNSPSLSQLPFLFWMLEAAKPQLHVSLGVGDGVGYFGICQVLERLVPDVQNFGIDNWHDGTRHDPHIPDSLRRWNEEIHPEGSHLIFADPAGYAPDYRQARTDLLVIAPQPTAVLAETILRDWVPRLSDQAIVVLRGTNTEGFASSPGGQLLETLTEGRVTARFYDGDGLTVVLWGEACNERLRDLFSLTPGEPGYAEIRTVFTRLGRAQFTEWGSRHETKNARDNGRKLAELTREHEQVLEQLAQSRTSYNERHRHAAELQSELHEMERAQRLALQERSDNEQFLQARIATLEHDLTESAAALASSRAEQAATESETAAANEAAKAKAEARITELEQALEEEKHFVAEMESLMERLDADAKALHGQQEGVGREIEALRNSAQWQGLEIQELRRKLDTQLEVGRGLSRDLAARAAEIRTLQDEGQANSERLAQLQSEGEALRSHNDSLLSSTSWRMTSPLRRAVDWTRSKRE